MADGNSKAAAESPVRVSCVPVPTALYRHYGKDGALLYVGVSLNTMARLAQHRYASSWFQDIANVTVEWLPDRAAALAAEEAAIRVERPLHNIMHNKAPASVERFIEDSRAELVERLVRYKPLYRLSEAAAEIGIGSGKLRLAADAGELRLILDGAKAYVTGWELLSFIEALETGAVKLRKMPVHNPHGPVGRPR